MLPRKTVLPDVSKPTTASFSSRGPVLLLLRFAVHATIAIATTSITTASVTIVTSSPLPQHRDSRSGPAPGLSLRTVLSLMGGGISDRDGPKPTALNTIIVTVI